MKTAVQPGTAEHTEMFWYLVELFTENDTDKEGIVTIRALHTMLDKVLETPRKLSIDHPDKVRTIYSCAPVFAKYHKSRKCTRMMRTRR